MMEKCLFISLLLMWICAISIGAEKRDICEKCVKLDDCGILIVMTQEQKRKWTELASCTNPKNNPDTIYFSPSSKSKEEYVCCPNESLWGTDLLKEIYNNDGNNYVRKPESPQTTLNEQNNNTPLNHSQNVNQNHQSNLKPIYQNPNVRPGSNVMPGQSLYRPDQNIYRPDQGVYTPITNVGGQQNVNENQNRLNNQGPYNNNQQNPIELQYPNYGNNANPGPYYPYVPSNQNNINNVNSNPYNAVNLERQCPVQSNLPPDPRTSCCGIDTSDSIAVTDLKNVLNMYAPSRNNNWRQRPNVYQMYPYRRTKRFAKNESDFMLDDRIAGGKVTELDQFPWTVLLKLTFQYPTKRAAYNCGGSLISQKYVLTAGHCVYENAATLVDVEVTLAEYDKSTFPLDCKSSLGEKASCIENIVMHAENVILHQQYDDDRLHNDIALIRLRDYAPYTRFVKPICLPPINIDLGLANLPLAVAGWGRNGLYNTNIKQWTVVSLVSHDECKDSYPDLTNAQLCAVGRTGEDTCKGDSGGPLMMLYKGNYYVVGVVSGKRADSPCGTRVPSLYTNVYTYLPWILNNISN